MPYKNPIKAAESAKRRYLANKLARLEYANNWYKENREKVLKQHKDKAPILREECKKWRKKNKDKLKEYKHKTKDKRSAQSKKDTKKGRDKLSTWYVVAQIKKQIGLTREEIKAHPELIEAHRKQIELKRLLKLKKHEANTKTR